MYVIQLLITNPLTQMASAKLVFKFDPATLDQAKWTSAYPGVAAALATLISESTPKEPPTW